MPETEFIDRIPRQWPGDAVVIIASGPSLCDEDIETVFLMADQSFAHVSSSLIKQIAPLASDEMLEKFVPPAVAQRLREKLR